MTTDTDKASDKLVEMAEACGIKLTTNETSHFAPTVAKLAAFRAAIIADLCGDVEPVAWIYWHPSNTRYDGPDTLHYKAVSRFTDDTRKAMLANGWLFEPLYPATVAALKAEIEALRKDAARYRLLRRGQKWSVVDGIGTVLRAEILDTAIDAAITARGKT